MCRPIISSYIEAPAPVQHDHRIPNPGHQQSTRMTGDGFENDAFGHHHGIHTEQHQDFPKWKGDSDHTGLEMDQVDHQQRGIELGGRQNADVDSSGNVTRSVWDAD